VEPPPAQELVLIVPPLQEVVLTVPPLVQAAPAAAPGAQAAASITPAGATDSESTADPTVSFGLMLGSLPVTAVGVAGTAEGRLHGAPWLGAGPIRAFAPQTVAVRAPALSGKPVLPLPGPYQGRAPPAAVDTYRLAQETKERERRAPRKAPAPSRPAPGVELQTCTSGGAATGGGGAAGGSGAVAAESESRDLLLADCTVPDGRVQAQLPDSKKVTLAIDRPG